MFGTRVANDGETGKRNHVGRIAEVLSFDPYLQADSDVAAADAETLSSTVVPEDPAGGSASPPPVTPQDPEVAPQVAPSRSATVREPGSTRQSFALIHQAAQLFADSLAEVVDNSVSDVRRHTEIDRSRLDSALEGVQELREEIGRTNTTHVALRRDTDSLEEAGRQQISRILALDDRVLLSEQANKEILERLDSLTAVQAAAGDELRNSTDRASGLEARLAETLQRLDAAEETIQALTVELEQHGVLWERFLGSLRAVEQRTEKRYPVKEPVQVIVAGEPERILKGHVTDASDNGMGLLLEAAIPTGTGVQVEVAGTRLTGTIRHSRARKVGYSVGVALTPAPGQQSTMPQRSSLSQTGRN